MNNLKTSLRFLAEVSTPPLIIFLTHQFLPQVFNAEVTSAVAWVPKNTQVKSYMLLCLPCNKSGETVSYSYVSINENTKFALQYNYLHYRTFRMQVRKKFC